MIFINLFVLGGRIFASPAARALAADLGIALSSIEGSGPNGRIVLADVENASSTKEPSVKTVDISSKGSSSSTADYEDIPNNNIRKVVASRLTESKQTIPHYYLTVDFCVDKLEQYERSILCIFGNIMYLLLYFLIIEFVEN